MGAAHAGKQGTQETGDPGEGRGERRETEPSSSPLRSRVQGLAVGQACGFAVVQTRESQVREVQDSLKPHSKGVTAAGRLTPGARGQAWESGSPGWSQAAPRGSLAGRPPDCTRQTGQERSGSDRPVLSAHAFEARVQKARRCAGSGLEFPPRTGPRGAHTRAEWVTSPCCREGGENAQEGAARGASGGGVTES